jgi:hypothetical protein
MGADTINDKGLGFLKNMNYTLSPFCRVLGPTLETSITYPTHSRFVLKFYNIMNDSYVEDNLVFLHLDIATGDVLGFGYYWTFVRSTPVENIISGSTAEHVALAYVNARRDYKHVEVTSSVLVLQNWGRNLTNSSYYKLVWVISGTFSTGFDQYTAQLSVEVHPISGLAYALADVQVFGVPIEHYTEVAAEYDVVVLTLSLLIAVLSFMFAKRLVTVTPAPITR